MSITFQNFIDKNESKIFYLGYVLFFCILIFSVIYGSTIIDKSSTIKYDKNISGIVTKIYVERSNTYFELDNNSIWRVGYSRNFKLEEPFIGDYLQKNDSIWKDKCSDTLFGIRGGTSFNFVIENAFYNSQKSEQFIENHLSQRQITINTDCK